MSMSEYITLIKETLHLDVLDVTCYGVFLIILTSASNWAANSRCFNPVYFNFKEQNQILSDYEQGPALKRQLRHIDWILKNEGKEISNVR